MDQTRQRTVLLAVAFLLPLIFIMVVFASTYIPSSQLQTDYDFVYARCMENGSPGSFYCSNYLQNLYQVENGRLQELAIPEDLDSDNDGVLDINENYRTRLFLHDTDSNTSDELPLTDVQQLQLIDEIVSPDGVAVEHDYSGGGSFFLFGRISSRYGWYLTKGRAKQKLEIIGDNGRNYYRDDFRFIGWVDND